MENICKKIQEQTFDYISGSLANNDVAVFQNHINQCQTCKNYFEAVGADDQLLKNLSNFLQPSIDRIENNVIQAIHSKSALKTINPARIWRSITSSRITKLAAAAAFITIAAILVTLVDKCLPPAYALEQTVKANLAMRYLHLKYFDSSHKDVTKECWIECDQNGFPENVRINWSQWMGNGDVVIWNKDRTKIWSKQYNLLTFFKDEIYNSLIFNLIDTQNPGLMVESLRQKEAKGHVKIEIDKSSGTSEQITITATDSPEANNRQVLLVDQTTKLVTTRKWYKYENGEYKHQGTFEYLDYNVPINPRLFSLEGELPEDIKLIDPATQEIGLAQENLTDEQIAIKVASEFLKSLIARDYNKAAEISGSLDSMVKKSPWGKIKVIRIISIGDTASLAEPSSLYPNSRTVNFTIEVEENGVLKKTSGKLLARPMLGRRSRWIVSI